MTSSIAGSTGSASSRRASCIDTGGSGLYEPAPDDVAASPRSVISYWKSRRSRSARNVRAWSVGTREARSAKIEASEPGFGPFRKVHLEGPELMRPVPKNWLPCYEMHCMLE